MKKISYFFILSVVFFLVTGLCQATTTILTSASPDHNVTSGSEETIYGTSTSNRITIESGAKAELINFSGLNVIEIKADSNGFTVYRSGTVVTFDGPDGTRLKIPATTSVQTIAFSDRAPLTLSIYQGQVMLDDQVVTTTASSIVNGSEFTCGAYIAPGVWKEFDCYNLAAIGKTTKDDPFTPSWRLIGGYWQWGRKGPDPSQWYDTNTEHFAHGPTGPGDSEANEGEISNLDDDYAPDGSWSDSEKTANDPCPSGYRVPTQGQWDGVVDNNTQSTVGTWDSYDITNYSSARFFGSDLMLPAAGLWIQSYGWLFLRGNYGRYWSSTEFLGNSINAWCLGFNNNSADTYDLKRRSGFSVRCVAE